jgi:hypothetical protein
MATGNQKMSVTLINQYILDGPQSQSGHSGEDKNLVTPVGFEVLMAVGTKMAVFWVVAP